MAVRRNSNRGFTLIEILIVVIILGILAAIVIPQFTSASTDARNSSLSTTVQTINMQVQAYKLQHNDHLPDLTANWDCLTHKTDVNGNIDPANGPSFGPYLQSTPVNSLTGTAVPVVVDGTAFVAGADFVYDYAGGAGTGKIQGTTSTAASGALAHY
ncbi:MAG TPA: prepilin-type N-terminal cleavage/methylation domain-containing protein [Tepidisphaeraceae bacterium]|nr:prepilin-type N-terminal cleavage/methylation domain-containing protein [Tepidisphaeraceae bacterium]